MPRSVTFSPEDQSSPMEIDDSSQDSTDSSVPLNTPGALSPGNSTLASSSSEESFKKPSAAPKKSRAKLRSKKKNPPGFRDDVTETSLYYQIFCRPVDPMLDIVNTWISDYKINQQKAVLTLIQFFIDASGCKGYQITLEMLENKNHEKTVESLSQYLPKDGFYPLIIPTVSKIFIKELSNFIETLINQCYNSILYDAYLFENAITFLVHMTFSLARAIRHTSTFISMKLHTSLVNTHVKLTKQLDATTRQLNAERNKSLDERALGRLETLAQKQDEFTENIEEIEYWRDTLIKNVYEARFRDVLSEIRTICSVELDNCMKKDPETYVKPEYLKFLGWLLFDDSSDMRSKSLEILQRILSANDEHHESLRQFIPKYSERVFAMIFDVDDNVATEAVNLSMYIFKYNRQLMSDDHVNNIYTLIYAIDRKLSQSVGDFFKTTLLNNPDNDTTGLPSLHDLVTFFLESDKPDHAPYLVDALIDTTPILKDWKAMTSFLTFAANDNTPADLELINQRETAIIKLMTFAIEETSTGKLPPGRVVFANKKQLSVKAQEKIKTEKRQITEFFITHLPFLLEKYQGDNEKLVYLLAIPQFFELSVYTDLRQEHNLDRLLDSIQKIVLRVFDEAVVEVAAKTLQVLCDNEPSISGRCSTQRLILIEAIDSTFQHVIDEIDEFGETCLMGNSQTLYKLIESLMKISIFSSCHDPDNSGYWNSVSEIIRKRVEDLMEEYSDEIVKYAIKACYYSVLWKRHQLGHDESVDSTHCSTKDILCSRLNTLAEFMRIILIKDDGKYSDELKETAFAIAVDLLNVFLDPIVDSNSSMSSNEYYDPTQYLAENVLENFVEKYVFYHADNEADEEKLFGKKRNLLAGYCKLIIKRLIPAELALPLFINYVEYYNDFGDIMKMTLGAIRDHDRCGFAALVEASLNKLWKKLDKDFQAAELDVIVKLAQRLLLFFGLDNNKNSQAMVTFHRNGIKFALKMEGNQKISLTKAPTNIQYLEVLTVFTNRLTKKTKELIMKCLLGYFPGGIIPVSTKNDWEPLAEYKKKLK